MKNSKLKLIEKDQVNYDKKTEQFNINYDGFNLKIILDLINSLTVKKSKTPISISGNQANLSKIFFKK